MRALGKEVVARAAQEVQSRTSNRISKELEKLFWNQLVLRATHNEGRSDKRGYLSHAIEGICRAPVCKRRLRWGSRLTAVVELDGFGINVWTQGAATEVGRLAGFGCAGERRENVGVDAQSGAGGQES
jgi:hypothetical protein